MLISPMNSIDELPFPCSRRGDGPQHLRAAINLGE
jgi:hypothetical protein